MKLPYITKKQQELIKLIYKFRFSNRIQLQVFIHHKDYKQINVWLRDLTEKKFLGRIYSRRFGESCKPAIYYVGKNGIKWLRAHPQSISTSGDENNEEFTERWEIYLKRLYKDKTRSQTFINHSIFISEIYKKFVEKEIKNKKNLISFKFFTASDIFNHELLHPTLGEFKPLPSGYIYKQEIKGEDTIESRYIVEIIDPGTPRFAIRARITLYIKYYYYEKWTEETGLPFPKLLIICPDKRIHKYLVRKIPKIRKEEGGSEISMELSLADDVRQYGMQGGIWLEVKDQEE